MSETKCRISEAEWLVMDVLWQASPQTAASIIERVRPETDWSPKTIHTLLSRLTGKGALAVDKAVAPHQYHPVVTREQCVSDEMNSFRKRFFNDSSFLTIANFIEHNKISDEEIEELKQLLDQKRR